MTGHNPKVIVVDDDFASLALAKATLQQAGYDDVDVFIDPLEAQKSYHKIQYDILILDLRMPVLSGFDILQDMNEIHGCKPNILVLTAQAEAGSEQRALDMGAKKVLLKPIIVGEFLQEFERLAYKT